MQKKLILGAMFVLFLLVSPLVMQGSAFNNYFAKRRTITASSDGAIFPFWYFCHINSTGYGKATHSGDKIFLAIEYTEDDDATTTIRTFFRSATLKGDHNFQIFFFIGEEDIPPSGVEGNCNISGLAMLVNIW